MSHETNGADAASLGVQRTAADDYIWIKCRGCGGEIGVPSDWNDPGAECPSCGLIIQVHGRVLYRPPTSGSVNSALGPQSATQNPFAIPVPKSPSLELGRQSDWTMIWGILSVVLGWTVMVPLIGLCPYYEASTLARKEGIPIPRRAIVGLILSLLFGTVQTIAMIAHFNH
jgi:DNA-directed RNA polymerase subunit RPC12/RpoP